MAKASYVEGLTLEGDERPPRLTIDGRPVEGLGVDEQGQIVVSSQPELKGRTLREVGEGIITGSAHLHEQRQALRAEHLAELRQGVPHWNQWRLDNPQVRPLLFNADLRREATGLADLNAIDFANANLIGSNLRGVHLVKANFHEANLGGADLSDAILEAANFCRTDLYATNLSRAKLRGANLQGTQMAMTVLDGAHLIGCKIYGMSAWDVGVKEIVQRDLVIVYRKDRSVPDAGHGSREIDESTIVVDNIETAQFVYLMLNNPKIAGAIDSLTSKVVLILGRFTDEQKAVLDEVREALRGRNYVPVLFDFHQPDSLSITDTVRLLSQMSLFVIADLTNPSSAPFELQNVYEGTSAPVQTIIRHPERPFSMFWDLRKEHPGRFLIPFSYRDLKHLMDNLTEKVVAPPVAASKALKHGMLETDEERKRFEAESDRSPR